MILAKARVIEGSNGTVRVGLTFPTGFDPDEVVKDSVRVNGGAPEAVSVRPRRGTYQDIYREFEVAIPRQSLGEDEGALVEISGRMRRGLTFTATVSLPAPPVVVAPHKNTNH